MVQYSARLHANLRNTEMVPALKARGSNGCQERKSFFCFFLFLSREQDVIAIFSCSKFCTLKTWETHDTLGWRLVHRRCTDAGAGQNAIKEKSKEWGKEIHKKRKERKRKEREKRQWGKLIGKVFQTRCKWRMLHANLRYANGTSAESERKQRVPRKKVFILLLFPFPSWLD